jgi:hypothetical protein
MIIKRIFSPFDCLLCAAQQSVVLDPCQPVCWVHRPSPKCRNHRNNRTDCFSIESLDGDIFGICRVADRAVRFQTPSRAYIFMLSPRLVRDARSSKYPQRAPSRLSTWRGFSMCLGVQQLPRMPRRHHSAFPGAALAARPKLAKECTSRSPGYRSTFTSVSRPHVAQVTVNIRTFSRPIEGPGWLIAQPALFVR